MNFASTKGSYTQPPRGARGTQGQSSMGQADNTHMRRYLPDEFVGLNIVHRSVMLTSDPKTIPCITARFYFFRG